MKCTVFVVLGDLHFIYVFILNITRFILMVHSYSNMGDLQGSFVFWYENEECFFDIGKNLNLIMIMKTLACVKAF